MNDQLVHNVLLSEAQKSEYTPLELENIRLANENLFINYFLDRETVKIVNTLEIDDEVLQKIYDDNKEKFKVEPKFKLETIFFNDIEKANKVLDEITEANFEELKKENDTREKEEDKKEQFLSISNIIPQIALVVSQMKDNGIVKSLIAVNGGYHIVYLKEREEEREATFEEAKDMVKNEFKKSIHNEIKNKVVQDILNKKNKVVEANVSKEKLETRKEEKKK